MILKYKINTPNFILFDIPEGKINSKGELVAQPAQKGPTCGFYSAKTIRQPNRFISQTVKERAIEKNISSERKQLTELYHQQRREQELIGFFIEELKKPISECIKAKVKVNISLLKDMFQFVLDSFEEGVLESSGKSYKISDIKKIYQQLFDEFFKYCEKQKIEIKPDDIPVVLLNWLQEHQHRVHDQLVSGLLAKNNISCKFSGSAGKINTLTYYHFAQFGFCEKKIEANTTIDDLIKILQKFGSIIVVGEFGGGFYKKGSASKKIEIEKMTFHFWKKEDRLSDKEKPIDRHFITVIGASEENQLVYWIDSNYPSSEENPRPIFITTFDSFKEKLQLQTFLFNPNVQIKEQKSEVEGQEEEMENELYQDSNCLIL